MLGVVARTALAALGLLGAFGATLPAEASAQAAPTVTDVVFPNAAAEGDSLWRRLEHMRVAVKFDSAVAVTGMPRLALTIGANTRQAGYQSGSGSDSLVFSYRIEDTDEDTTGVSIGASALTLNNGTIKVSGGTTNANLSLGSHAVSNAATHKVDGITRFAGPVVFEDSPGADSTFGFGDRIRIAIYFNNLINAPGGGSVTLNVQIGARTVPFAYTGVGPNLLSFTHYVTTDDIDADGLSLPENALSGSVSGGGRAAFTGLRGNAITNDPTRKVNGLLGLPDVQRASITSDAGTDSTYVRGDMIEIGVVFDENVAVTGTPQLALTIGANTRQADYVSGSGGDSLTFRYATRTTDADADGISYSASALTLNGGTIKGTVVYGDTTRNAHLDLKTHVVANGAAHKVDGSQGPPVVVGLAVASDAGTDSAYVVGDTIEVGVVFVENVDVTGTPQLALTIGSQTGQASYVSGTGGDSLTFRYPVVAGNVDTDGLSIGESALTLNGGTIRRAGSTTVDAVLGLSVYAVTNAAAHKVLAVQGLPHVTGTAIASDPGTDSIYAAGDTIEVAVVFNENVNVTGTPQLALEIGAATRQASYVSGTGGDSLSFRYVTVVADTDSTGISYSADALALNGGTIRRVASTLDVIVSLLSHVVVDAAAHKVLPTSNKLTGLSVNSAGPDSTFVRGDTMKVTLTFRETTNVTGAPRIRMWLGATSRWATYHSGSGTSALEFRYVVEAGINDGNGVGILADAVDLNGGAVRAANQVNVSVWIASSLTIVDGPAWKVAGNTRITSASVGRPPTGNVFERGDTIVVTMVYSDSVDVTGVPTAWLNFASATHNPALYASGTGTDTLKFRYVVQAADSDPNGLSLYGNAIQLTGGSTIREAGTTTSAFHDTPWPHLGQNALTNSPDHIVAGAERITSVSLGPPPVGDTFERGDTIKVIVVYSGSVDVTGVPTVWMNIGTNNYAGATYASGTGTDTLEFHRVVEATDVDGDGISIGGNALQLTGTPASTITDAGTNVAVLGGTPWGTTTNAITNSGGHKVQGGTFTATAVSGVAVTSTPSSGDTYELGERIEIGVSFNRGVVVTGTPWLALEIGSDTVQASYASGSGTKTLAFRYTVTAADADPTGISIGASALALNGGTIGDGRDTTVAASLALGSNAIADATAHKVDGAQGPPGVAGLVVGSPLVGDTFERGETIEVSVAFNKSVDVTGTPQLALGIGSATKQADYAVGTGTDTLMFRYEVVTADVDADGLSIGSGALALNGGTIRVSGGTTDAVLGLGVHAITNSTGHKVAGGTFTASAPSGVAIASAPSSDSTYGRTEMIEVEVTFTRPVDVTGTPQLALTIDTLTRQASYASGSGTKTLAFRYTVVAADADSTGIGIAASALALNGGTIADARDGSTAASLGLGSHAIANAAAHKVDGSLGPPGVTSLTIGSPVVGDVFERGETIEVELEFNRAVDVTGTPRLALTIGSATRQASYASGTGTTSLVFRYVVASGDADADGLSIGSGALTLSGGTIRLAGGTLDATLGLGVGVVVTNSGGHQVSGSTFTTPAVSAVTISSVPASGQTYQLGESIEVKVAFGRPVAVTGSPRLALTIGTQTRQASWESATSKADTLVFGYAIRPADADTDGLSIGASALTLNGGAIADVRPGAAAAELGLGANAVSNAASHKVNGSLGPPGVVGLTVAAPPVDDTFERGDTIVATVTFNKAVDATGAPQLALLIGAQQVGAYASAATGTTSLEFRYVVISGDADTDGLSIRANALTLNGGTIDVAGGTTDALLSLAHHAISNASGRRVAGGTFTAASVSAVSITSSPAGGGTYGLSEEIGVNVTFNRNVAVTGSPELALTIGSQTRQASYVTTTGGRVLSFAYTVVAADADGNGLSIGASALSLNGGTIADARDANEAASLGLGGHAISNSGAHRVDGNQGPPGVSAVSIASPVVGDVFERGDTVVATVVFNKAVDVTGTPQLALGIGSTTKQASYASGTGTASLVFRYVVVTADADVDGISIAAGALALNGGTIDVAGGTVDAVLGLGAHAISNSAGHKVAGGTFTAASVSGVSLTSSPAVATTYGRDERIEVQVTFNRRVAVTGTPRVALTVGAQTRQADYASGTGTRALTFRYVVVAADADTDGIEVGASALALNSGTIADARDGSTAAALGLGSHALSAAAGHKVDGTLAGASVTGVAVSSTPDSADTYGLGERIEVEVTFDRAVTVTGAPRLALTVGTVARQASYADGSGTATLSFAYRVRGAGSGGSGTGGVDADADGVGVAAAALTLNGGTIVNTADGVRPATLGLGAHAIAAAANDKVDGTVEVAPVVVGVAVTSEPVATGLYGAGGVIRVEVTFSRPVEVAGASSSPALAALMTAANTAGARLAIDVGGTTRHARYVSGSGTTVLVFEYVVLPADRDPDGISIPADALAEAAGALRIAGGQAAAVLDLGAHAVTDLTDHAVNGAGSLDPVFGRLEYEFELAENVAGPLPVGEVVATSPLGAEMRYGLESGGEGLFEVDVSSGVVTYVGGGEDAEQRSEYVMLVVAVTDGVGEDEQLETVAKVTVKVMNENDEAPSFVEERWVFELAEDVAGPLVLGVLEAADLDEGDTLTYALVAGDAQRFELDAGTGELRYVGGGEDYEGGAGPWVLEATATDLLGRTARTTATVVVADVNEAPAFADSAYAFELAENAAGPLVLGAVRATDPDRDDPPAYSLAEGDAERFEVDAVTGELRYVGEGEDAETGPESWALEVRATDRGGVAASARVVVALLDRNEAPVFAAEVYEWEFEENVAGPLVLGSVEAADPDRADTLVYSLSGEGAALFEVDAETGEVRYAGEGEDYEAGPERWEFEVVATDGEGLAARAVATVALLDVNEAPAFADSAYAFELAENAAGPLMLGAVEATDPDRGDAPAYSLAEGDAERFEVDARTGALQYVGSGEDYEQGPPSFALTVRATDAGGLTAEAGVVVTLLDVNEGPEAVGAMSPKTLEAYGDAVEEELAQYFRDPDGDALAYAVESSSPAVAAATVTGAGRLSIVPHAIGEAVVTVLASDPGGLSVRQQVRVTVEASRSERARALELTLAAFGRSLGTETVEAVGGRLGLGSSGALGRSHVQLGGRSLACGTGGSDVFGAGGFADVAAAADGRTDIEGDVANAVHGQADDGQGNAAAGGSGQAAGGGNGDAGGSGHCGLESLVRGATGLLGLQIVHPGSPDAAGGTVDLAALFFGDGRGGAFGQPTAGGAGGMTGMGGMGGAYQGRQQPEAGRADRGGLTFNPVDARGLRSQSSFQLAFGGSDAPADASSAGASVSSQAAVRLGWTVWGQANLGEFEGRPQDGFAMDGRTRSAYLGLDYRFASGVLMGLAGSRSDMEAGFDSDVNGAGSVDARLTSLYPYLHWSSGGGFGVWGLAGAGRGDATLEESAGGRFDTDLEMRMGALGVRQELTGGLALKADAFAVRILSDDVAGLAGVTADAQRVRLAPEIGGQWQLGGGLAMRTRLEVGGRFDGGDAETGMGAEAGAEVGLAHQASGFSMTARGRALLVHQERDFKDWGAGFSLRLQPGGGGEGGGLSFSVEPTWGDAGRGARALWQGGAEVWRTAGAGGFGAPGGAARPVGANVPAGTGLAHNPGDPSAQGASAADGGPTAGSQASLGLPASSGLLAATGAPGWAPDRVAMEVGYGVLLPGGNQVKPFGRWSREGPTGHRVNVGTRWSLLGGETTGQLTESPGTRSPGLQLMMDLFGEHVASGVQPPERRIGLSGRIVFE